MISHPGTEIERTCPEMRLRTGSTGSSTTTTTMATPRTIFHFDGQTWTESSRQCKKSHQSHIKKQLLWHCEL